MKDMEPAEPVTCYEHKRPGELLHRDTQKLGRIDCIGQRISGDRHKSVPSAGLNFPFVAVDDRSSPGLTEPYPDARTASR